MCTGVRVCCMGAHVGCLCVGVSVHMRAHSGLCTPPLWKSNSGERKGRGCRRGAMFSPQSFKRFSCPPPCQPAACPPVQRTVLGGVRSCLLEGGASPQDCAGFLRHRPQGLHLWAQGPLCSRSTWWSHHTSTGGKATLGGGLGTAGQRGRGCGRTPNGPQNSELLGFLCTRFGTVFHLLSAWGGRGPGREHSLDLHLHSPLVRPARA